MVLDSAGLSDSVVVTVIRATHGLNAVDYLIIAGGFALAAAFAFIVVKSWKKTKTRTLNQQYPLQ